MIPPCERLVVPWVASMERGIYPMPNFFSILQLILQVIIPLFKLIMSFLPAGVA